MNATHEEWRPVVGYEGSYEVSSLGRVRSLDRVVKHSNGFMQFWRGQVLRPGIHNSGRYPFVNLPKRPCSLVHVLVLEAFVGPRPEGCAACHNDGDPTNNATSNLRWDTYRENNLDLLRHGTHWQANKTHCPQGHEYGPGNTHFYRTSSGGTARVCRTCKNERNRQYRAKQRQRKAATA